MDTKKIVTLLVVLGLVGLIAWQGSAMFGGGEEAAEVAKAKTIPNPDKPTPASLVQTKAQEKAKVPLTEREMQLMALQKQMQEKYMATLNTLQQLTADLAVAEANKLIMKAKADTVESQKKIVTILSPPPPKNLNTAMGSSSSGTNVSASGTAAMTGSVLAVSAPTVVSVTNIRGKWNAVIGVGDKLYNVSVGDILAADGSTVTAISKSGVTLVKDNKEVQIAMNSVI